MKTLITLFSLILILTTSSTYAKEMQSQLFIGVSEEKAPVKATHSCGQGGIKEVSGGGRLELIPKNWPQILASDEVKITINLHKTESQTTGKPEVNVTGAFQIFIEGLPMETPILYSSDFDSLMQPGNRKGRYQAQHFVELNLSQLHEDLLVDASVQHETEDPVSRAQCDDSEQAAESCGICASVPTFAIEWTATAKVECTKISSFQKGLATAYVQHAKLVWSDARTAPEQEFPISSRCANEAQFPVLIYDDNLIDDPKGEGLTESWVQQRKDLYGSNLRVIKFSELRAGNLEPDLSQTTYLEIAGHGKPGYVRYMGGNYGIEDLANDLYNEGFLPGRTIQLLTCNSASPEEKWITVDGTSTIDWYSSAASKLARALDVQVIGAYEGFDENACNLKHGCSGNGPGKIPLYWDKHDGSKIYGSRKWLVNYPNTDWRLTSPTNFGEPRKISPPGGNPPGACPAQ